MSPRLQRLLLGALLLAAAVAAWSYLSSPQRRVYRRLDELGELLEKSGEESGLIAAANARAVGELFAPGFLVRAAPYEGTLTDPQQLMGAVLRFRGAASRISVSFTGREALVQEAPGTALVTFVATVTMDRGRGPGRESWRVRSLWVEDEGAWRISELELAERLEGGGLLPW